MTDLETISTLKLLDIKPEAGNVKTFIFETGGLTWIAGQSQRYILPQAGTTKAETERRFTIATAPSEGVISVSARISESTFKQALNALKPGDLIQRKSLKGDFTWEEEPSEPLVLVAGGIGVTPYRAILLERDAWSKKIPATLLYFNRTDEIPFLEEFKSLAAKHPEFNLVPIVGESITAENIFKHLPDYVIQAGAPQSSKQTIYLSGPEPMVETVGEELKKLGINIKQDWFSGYDEKNY